MKLLLVTVLLFGAAAPLHAQERVLSSAAGASTREPASIVNARELYASARYEEALSVLNALIADETTPADVKVIEQYRSFCLLALGRTDEAQAAIEAVVAADPFYQPREEDVAPRIRATFADVRQRLLPDIAATRYNEAKQAYDQKQFVEAERLFRELVALLKDPQMNGRHGDMRTLASGFLELASAAAAPPPAPRPEEAPKAAPPPPPPSPPRIYVQGEAGVVPPAIVRQNLPAVPSTITATARPQGLLELIIDEQGRVVSVTLRTGVHPVYDSMLLSAVQEWKYRPATLNGQPVKFRKLIQVNVRRE